MLYQRQRKAVESGGANWLVRKHFYVKILYSTLKIRWGYSPIAPPFLPPKAWSYTRNSINVHSSQKLARQTGRNLTHTHMRACIHVRTRAHITQQTCTDTDTHIHRHRYIIHTHTHTKTDMNRHRHMVVLCDNGDNSIIINLL